MPVEGNCSKDSETQKLCINTEQELQICLKSLNRNRKFFRKTTTGAESLYIIGLQFISIGTE